MIKLIHLTIFIFLIISIFMFLKLEPNATSSTIAFVSDARPSYATSNIILTEDFNQIIPQSPNGKVDAVVMIGDMDPINNGTINTVAAYSSSTARNIPSFFAVGNHELDNPSDFPAIRSKFSSYSYHPKKGPAGTSDTTYSFDVGDIHVIVLNEYWDGGNNGACAWYAPKGRINMDDSCMKYSGTDGGYIPDGLFSWLQKDLSTNKKNWTVVGGHEVLYPQGTNHGGDSLDENKTNRDRLQKLFISKNVTAFVGGHTHHASLTTIGNVFHADAGVFGVMAGRGAPNDNFATIIYANVNESGYFTITKVSENPTWSTPVNRTLTKVKATQ
ncbi:MAG: metallophosphoesterase [Candidatus Methanoperedens sp.]|nr:metallophosphoesterase [Candidatus Methanoperedens sp.]